ncbi:DoxX family protein [Mycolicibacillus parakoreensis]|uniref:DoxX family protein n=1 Tax=Mycolicibacillus parakoreensis TaxID=1069221 RepID=A0ABY3TTW9_9MYCO|nr:DoxX family protein [Mycolicibacillus parakoreensis]MCV7316805.1 DoxX family protein [Mycolicibacillus parakoreensis]ULN51172.1 DoxX family protein [Mycolicibacillus parakoreensis]HLR98637.1 DoxX family protein [Mycolicibacillus parakoreensis]
MSVLTSSKTYRGLAVLQAGDAVACAIPVPYIAESLDTLGVPAQVRPVLPAVKVASALGLASASRLPRLGRLTTAALTLYFVLAVAAHVRVKDRVLNTVPAATLLVTFAAMTAAGPPRRRDG